MFRRQKGFSLVELLLVLGVLALLLVGAFIVYPQVRDRNLIRQEVVSFNSFTSSIRNLYASRGSYLGINQTIAHNARAFPSNMNSTTASATSSFGTPVVVRSGFTDAFIVIYRNVPKSLCLPLLTANYQGARQIKVGTNLLGAAGTPVFNDGAATPTALTSDQGGRFDPTLASSLCQAGASSTLNISFEVP